jgi:hypothetical protein
VKLLLKLEKMQDNYIHCSRDIRQPSQSRQNTHVNFNQPNVGFNPADGDRLLKTNTTTHYRPSGLFLLYFHSGAICN